MHTTSAAPPGPRGPPLTAIQADINVGGFDHTLVSEEMQMVILIASYGRKSVPLSGGEGGGVVSFLSLEMWRCSVALSKTSVVTVGPACM